MPEMTYAKAGVDIRKEELAIKNICNWVRKTFKFRENKLGSVMQDIGMYANLVDLGGEYVLAVTTDGVGTKVLVAQELEKYDTIGIDMVAMNVNDVICVGAEPICLVDYLAMEHVDYEIVKEIGAGIYEGAKQSNIAVVGGETATLPEIITGVDGRGFDLAGTAIGLVKKDRIMTGDKIALGDAVVGFSSSGIHSNGLTLARKTLPKDMWIKLLDPTRIYVKEVMTLLKEYEIHGLAHITGAGFLNLSRLTKYGYLIDNPPEPQMVFKKIQELGKITDKEMYRTFNMGVGFCALASKKDAENIVEAYGKEYGLSIIGRIVDGEGIKIIKDNKEIHLVGDVYANTRRKKDLDERKPG